MFNVVVMLILCLLVQQAAAVEKQSTVSVERTMDEEGIPQSFSLMLYGSDADEDQVQWSISDQAKHGVASLSLSGKAISVDYQPEQNWNGTDVFYVQANDGSGGINKIKVTVHVLPRNDPPVNKKIPTVSGSAEVGQSLTANKGYWDDSTDGESADFSYHYQWMRAIENRADKLVPIQGAVSRQYFVTEADRKHYLAVQVTAKDKKTTNSLSASAFIVFTV